ncbi:MAG: GNAT family N-acetyltransferase [Elusimicrobia bacterium]|nr:GNAT family N-acetyltransferase [Elusimicrobiota bacterium]
MEPLAPLDAYTFDQPRGPADWEAVSDICCSTADSGKGVGPERREFFAEYWVRPYERLAPEWTMVALHEGRVAGYLCGCPATARFVLARHFLIRWPLFLRVCGGAYPGCPDAAAFVRRFIGLARDFNPAHLHVNVDPGHQGRGIGKRFMELFAMRLRQNRVPGLHLVCGDGPVGFYQSLGFTELASLELKAGARLHAMGLILG